MQIITEMFDYKGNSVMVFVELDTHAQNQDAYINAHIINSIYGRKNVQKLVETARSNGRLLYEKKARCKGGDSDNRFRY